MQMLQELVVQAEADPLPIPPSRQPFRLKTQTSATHVPTASQLQQMSHTPQVPLQRSQQPPSQVPLMRPPQPSPAQIQGHNHNRHSVPGIMQNPVPTGANYGLATPAVQDFYMTPTMEQPDPTLQYADSSLGQLGVSQAGMPGMNGYSY